MRFSSGKIKNRFSGISISLSLLLVCFVSLATNASAKDGSASPPGESTLELKPKWEFGIGGGYVEGFDYPASDNPNPFGGLLPYLIYRSEKFRFNGRGVSAIAMERSRFKLDVSMAASLNADAEGNELRTGMPDLDYLFEIGPQLVIRLIDTDNHSNRTLLNWSNRFRAVVSTDFGSVKGRGWVAQSQFQWRRERLFSNKLDIFATLSFTWAGEKLQDYFYEVDQEFQTATRPAYDANSGFLSTTLLTGVGIRPHPNLRVFLALNTGYFGGAANEDSPLFETRSTTGAAIGFVWNLRKSKEMVSVLDDEQ